MTDSLWYVVGVLVFVVGLAASIALHELGHMIPAKRFGVRVTQYMIGFGPTVWSRHRGETEYGVKAIPLGGYIRMIGMFPPRRGDTNTGDTNTGDTNTADTNTADMSSAVGRAGSSGMFAGLIEGARQQSLDEIRPGDERRTFYGLKVWQKLVVMLGGPVMNLVLGTVLLGIVMTTLGLGQETARIATVSECVLPLTAPADTECSSEDPPAPSAAAGIRPGDVVLSIDGVPTATGSDLRSAIARTGGDPVTVVVERNGEQLRLTATPIVTDTAVRDEDGQVVTDSDGEIVTAPAGFLGVSPAFELVRQPLTAVPGRAGDTVVQVAGVLLRLPQYLVGVAQAAFGSGERDPEGPVSVVGVGRFAGEIASADSADGSYGLPERTADILGILAGLNMALFVFNLIPLLPLDGGHAAGALLEGARKVWARLRSLPDPGPVDVAKALPLAYGVAVILLGMSALLIYADIVRPIRLTG